MLNGIHYEGEAVVGVGKHIFAAGKGTPAVDATKTHLGFIDADVGEVGFLYLWAVALLLLRIVVEAVDTVVEGGDGEGILRLKLQTIAGGVELLPVAYIGLGAGLLRTDIGVELVGYLLIVDSEECGVIAVGVVLDRSAAIVFDGIKLLGHLHLHSEAEEIAYIGSLCRIEFLHNHNITFR